MNEGRAAAATDRPSQRSTRSSGRRLAVLVIAALVGAGCCAGASGIIWWTRDYHDSLIGQVHTALHGSAVLGGLVPVALVALAGLGAVFATRGPLRRAVGVLVALGGLLVLVRAVLALGDPPLSRLSGQLTRPATATGPADLVAAGPALAMLGGVLILVAGVLVAAGADRTRGMGSAYESPGRRRELALQRSGAAAAGAIRDTSGTAPAGRDPAGGDPPGGDPPGGDPTGTTADPSEWWRALDAGADPTEDRQPEPAGRPATAGEPREADSADSGRPGETNHPEPGAR